MAQSCKTFLKFIIVLILSIVAIPAVLLLILINLIIFILRLPFYLYHKCKYQWCYSNIKSILPPVTMGFTTKVFYHGPNPCYDGNTFITVTLYLNKQVTTQLIKNKASFLYEFSRFRYIPHRSWLTGTSQFSHANDTDEITPNDVSPHIHFYHDTDNNPLTNTDEVQQAINHIGNTEMNRNIPWWDIHLINCDVDDYKSVIIFRCDHCLGDGATLLKFLMPRLLSDADGNPIAFDIKPREPITSSCCAIFGDIINGLWSVYALLTKTADTFNQIIVDMNAKFGSQSLVHHSISAQNVLEIQQLLNDDEEIRTKLEIMDGHYVSLNDILISIASGALRGVLLKSSEEFDRETINNSGYKTLMIVGKPFEIETAKSIENSWIPASVPFLVNIEDNVERCVQTAKNLKPVKRYWYLWANFFALQKLGNFWIDAVKCISYRLSNTHCCHYSYLNFKPFKDNDTFIFGTDIMINDVAIFVGDTVKTHVVELFKFGNKLSLNLSVGQKGEKFAFVWFQEFEQICDQLLYELNQIKGRKENV